MPITSIRGGPASAPPARRRPRSRHAAWLALMLACGAIAEPLDPATIDQAAAIAFQRASQAAGKPAEPAVRARARRIANRITLAAASRSPDAAQWHWTLDVVNGDALALDAYPGGRLLMRAGLVTRTGFADDEIAALLAQAVAHLMLGHVEGRLPPSESDAALRSPDPNRRALAAAPRIEEAVARPRYSAEETADADQLAIELLARAAYDPRAMGSAWRRLARERAPLAEAQPVSDARLAAIDAEAKGAMARFEEARARAEQTRAAPRPPQLQLR